MRTVGAQESKPRGTNGEKVTVTLIDDFDGEGAADETVEFGLDGVTYEIDLSSKNATKLRAELKKWADAGRRVGGRRRGRAAASADGAVRSTASRVRLSGNGLAVTVTTCPPAAVSADIIDAFHAAT